MQQQIRVTDNKIDTIFIKSDHADLDSVQSASEQIIAKLERLDIVILNAGVMGRDAALTKDGIEWHFGVNHLAHALMIKLLMPLLNTTADKYGDARLLVMSSRFPWLPQQGIVFETLNTEQDWWYGGRWMRYGQSKLANAAYATTVAEKEPKISCISLHPGVVSTGLWDHSLNLPNRLFTWLAEMTQIEPLEVAVLNICWAVTTAKANLKPGAYYERPDKPGLHSSFAGDAALRERLWNWTEMQLESRM